MVGPVAKGGPDAKGGEPGKAKAKGRGRGGPGGAMQGIFAKIPEDMAKMKTASESRKGGDILKKAGTPRRHRADEEVRRADAEPHAGRRRWRVRRRRRIRVAAPRVAAEEDLVRE